MAKKESLSREKDVNNRFFNERNVFLQRTHNFCVQSTH